MFVFVNNVLSLQMCKCMCTKADVGANGVKSQAGTLTMCMWIEGMAMWGCRYVTNTEWVSGRYDGSVALWSQLKKKPVSLHRGVHATGGSEGGLRGPGSPSEEAAGWVQSMAVCPQSDLVVRIGFFLRHVRAPCGAECLFHEAVSFLMCWAQGAHPWHRLYCQTYRSHCVGDCSVA